MELSASAHHEIQRCAPGRIPQRSKKGAGQGPCGQAAAQVWPSAAASPRGVGPATRARPGRGAAASQAGPRSVAARPARRWARATLRRRGDAGGRCTTEQGNDLLGPEPATEPVTSCLGVPAPSTQKLRPRALRREARAVERQLSLRKAFGLRQRQCPGHLKRRGVKTRWLV